MAGLLVGECFGIGGTPRSGGGVDDARSDQARPRKRFGLCGRCHDHGRSVGALSRSRQGERRAAATKEKQEQRRSVVSQQQLTNDFADGPFAAAGGPTTVLSTDSLGYYYRCWFNDSNGAVFAVKQKRAFVHVLVTDIATTQQWLCDNKRPSSLVSIQDCYKRFHEKASRLTSVFSGMEHWQSTIHPRQRCEGNWRWQYRDQKIHSIVLHRRV